MERTHLKAKPAALRMFPRLASKAKLNHVVSVRRVSTESKTKKAAEREPDGSARSQLRLRLLNMIVSNEKLRRQEPHAS